MNLMYLFHPLKKKKKKSTCFIKCKANYISTSGDLGHLQRQNISVNSVNYPFKLQLSHFFKIKCNKNILLQLNLKKRVKKKKKKKKKLFIFEKMIEKFGKNFHKSAKL